LRDYIMPPTGEVSTGVIISDVIGKTQSIAIFSGLTRDIDDVAGRLDNAAQNATVLAPDNSVMRSLKRKPWEDPEEYNTFGANAYEGSASYRDMSCQRVLGKKARRSRPLPAMKSGGKPRTAKRR
jgi:hypothetical protein